MIFGFGWLLSSCSVTRMLPSGPVISAAARVAEFYAVAPSGAAYTAPPDAPSAPRIPFLVFGVTYDIDLVLVTNHPEWDMHEYARISTPDGPIWLAKDARASTGDQLLVADIDGIDSWLPEIPLARKSAPVRVEDRSDDDQLDLSIAYQNHDGEPVRVDYRGPRPHTLQPRRNGSTMGHSRGQVLAVLDLSHLDFAKKATVSIGGVERKIHRVAGLVPMRMALRQTQGGVAEARFEQANVGENVTTTHEMPSGAVVTQTWQWARRAEFSELRQHHSLRDVVYHFRHTADGAAELVEAIVTPWDTDRPNFRIRFSPALPDLRARFSGEVRSRFVIDVGTQANHAVGEAVVRWKDAELLLEMRSEKPWWTADRVVRSALRTDGSTRTSVHPR